MIRPVFRYVVLCEFLSDFVRGYTDDGVLAGIETLRKLKNLDTNRTLFEGAAWTGNRVLNDIVQKLAASFAGAKRGALKQAMEFGPDFFRLRLTQSLRLTFAHRCVPLHNITAGIERSNLSG